jgi:16S rRNA processing protein RimM
MSRVHTLSEQAEATPPAETKLPAETRLPSDATGSPPPGEPVFLAVGRLRRPHGVRGEILMDILTDFPERLRPGITLYAGSEHQALHLTHCRWHSKALLMSFEGYHTPEDVGELRNRILYVSAADRPPLPEGEYYHHQLIGLQIVDEAGKSLGRLTEILETGANDVLVVRPPVGAEILLPLIDPVVLKIDLERQEILVRLLPGILNETET